jgi:hypothetical protein
LHPNQRSEDQGALLIKLIATQLFEVMPVCEKEGCFKRCEHFFTNLSTQLKNITAADFAPIQQ